MITALYATRPVGFSVPSTKPRRSRSSKYLNPWTSSTTVTAPRSRSMIWPASSKQRSICVARMWKSRSPGVETARCLSPTSAGNGCSSSGRGPLNKRSHASDPTPATHVSSPSGRRKPTARCSPAQSLSNSRAVGSPPGSMVNTRKIAAPVSGLRTGWASAPISGSGDPGKASSSQGFLLRERGLIVGEV